MQKQTLGARLEKLEEERASEQTRLESAVGAREAAEQRAAELESRLLHMSAEVVESTSLLKAKDKQLAEVDAERVELAARERHLSQLVDVSSRLCWHVSVSHAACVWEGIMCCVYLGCCCVHICVCTCCSLSLFC